MKGLFLLCLLLQVIYVSAQSQFIRDTNSEIVMEKLQSKEFEWIDVDNDGDLDLFVTNDSGSSLYINQGNGVFIKSGDAAINNSKYHTMGRWGDYDNDGFLDLFQVNYSRLTPDELIRNNGDGTFKQIQGLGALSIDKVESYNIVWVDYDNDGDMDIYVGNGDSSRGGKLNALYVNIDGKIFERLTSSPIVDGYGSSTQCQWFDIDNDGDLDLMVSNSSWGISIYVNSGLGVFEKLESFPSHSVGWSSYWAWTDYNGDGMSDVLVAEKNPVSLYINDASLTFSKIDIDLGIQDPYSYETTWGDFDNDGNLDLLIRSSQNIQLFKNDGNNTFQKVNLPSFDQTGFFTGGRFVDYDLDGNLDIYVSRQNDDSDGAFNLCLKNQGNSNHWLLVKLIGSHPNHTTDHAKVLLYTSNKMQHRSRVNYFAKGGGNSMYFHYGLGSSTVVDSIVVQWGSGTQQVLYNITSKQLLEIEEPFNSLPNAPIDLNSSIETYRKIHLSWTDQTDLETHYIIERSKSPDDNYARVAQLLRNTLSYVDFGLEANTTYTYKLYAINKAGASVPVYHTLTTITAPPVPNSPAELSEKNTAYQVALSWQDLSDNETEFVIERSEGHDSSFKKIATTGENHTSYVDKEVQPKTNYNYRIAASNDGILSPYSDIVTLTTGFIYFHEALAFPGKHANGLEFVDYDGDKKLDLFYFGWNGTYKNIIYRDINTPSYDSLEMHGVNNSTQKINFGMGEITNDNEPDYFFGLYEKVLASLSNDERKDFSSGMSYHHRIYVKDLNQDGRDELVLLGNGIEIHFQLPNKTFNVMSYLRGINLSDVIILDYDGDGDLDILTFYNSYNSPSYGSKILVNNNGKFNIQEFSINQNVTKAVPADYDHDGDIDLFLLGKDNQNREASWMYKNMGGGNFQFVTSLSAGTNASWIDYDNDGDLDLIIAGIRSPINYYEFSTTFFENKGNDVFEEAGILEIPGSEDVLITVGDYDGDGDMDLAITIDHWNSQKSQFKLYKNHFVEENGKRNVAPAPPANLNSSVNFNTATLTWDKSTDGETPQDGLTYNVVVRRKGSDENEYIVSPLSDLTEGFRKIPYCGNAGSRASYNLTCLPDGEYLWSVQAVDNNFIGSEFVPFEVFTISGTQPIMPSEIQALSKSNRQITLTWKDNANNETAYLIERKLVEVLPPPYESQFYLIDSLPANTQFFTDSSLLSDKEYTYRVTAYNCSAFAVGSVSVKTFPEHFSTDPRLLLDKTTASAASFGDFDSDGDLDILIHYTAESSYKAQTKIFENVGSTYLESNIPLAPYENFSWVDLNGDGFLDIFMINDGWTNTTPPKVYMNNGNGTFTESELRGLTLNIYGVYNIAWADFDNDGDQDGLLNGSGSSWTALSSIKLLENQGSGTFISHDLPFSGVIKSRNPWGDFNNDGNIDIVATESNGNKSNLVVYLNRRNKEFTKIDSNLPGLNNDVVNNVGDMAWGDYNGDGYLDLLIAGQHGGSSGEGILKVYKNNKGTSFTEISIDDKQYTDRITVKWGDFDNDGKLDILIYGEGRTSYQSFPITRIYRNLGSDRFTEQPYSFFDEYSREGSLSVADYDNDGDLDILHMGEVNYTHPRIIMFRNNYADRWNIKNQLPMAPVSLNENISSRQVKLSWNKALDDLSESLSYNVILKNEAETIVVPNALPDGFRTVVSLGNAGMNQFFIVRGLKKGNYQWSVQAIDGIFRGSPFSEYRSFTLSSDLLETITSTSKDKLPVLWVYPNPAKEYLMVELPDKASKGYVELMTIDGRLIDKINISGGDGLVKINIKNYIKGLQLIRITQGAYSHIEKVLFE